MHARRCPFRLSARAQALLLLLGALAGGADAAIVTLGQVTPDPSSGVAVGNFTIGQSGAGSVAVNGGSSLLFNALSLGNQPGGNGSLSVSGAGSVLNMVNLDPLGTSGNPGFGQLGTGSLSVLAGGTVNYNAANNDCGTRCLMWVTNGAGSNGSVLVSGAGSSFNAAAASVTVGHTSVYTVATDGFDFGTPGATSTGSARVDGGAIATTSRLAVGTPGNGNGRTGTERSIGSVLIDGIGSAWTLVRQAAQAGDQALLALGTGANAQGTVAVQNGGRLRIDGSAGPGVFTGASIGSGGATSSGLVRVDGTGSRLEVAGPLGFINIGSGLAGSEGELRVANGGLVTGVAGGLPFMNVGRGGSSGVLDVSGNDAAGNASTVRLAGRHPLTDGGAFLNVGGTSATTGASSGIANITAGGRLEIDTRAEVLGNGSALSGFHVGIGDGANGALNVAGRSALTGAASTLLVQGGTGLAPYAAVGRDGANGTVDITAGGQLLLDSAHASTGAVNTSGNSLLFDIGRNNAGGALASTGQVNVSGAGSLLALSGTADNFIQVGRGNGGNGTLNVSNGGTVRSRALLVGTDVGAVGSVNINGAVLDIAGSFSSGVTAGTGGGIGVGRNGGIGTLNIGNHATVNISSADPRAGLLVGGSTASPGGTGTVNIVGGSIVNVSSPEAYVAVGSDSNGARSATGTLNVTGGSALNVNGSGAQVLIGRMTNTSGLMNVGVGSSVSATALIGVAHNGTVDTGGSGILLVDGSVTAANLINGTAGLIGGNGVINANVTNHGVINAGHSPGKLTINGGFDNSNGKIVLEILMQPDGRFIADQIVFGDPAHVTMGAGQIEFDFLGATDPNAFFATGAFQLDSFFKELDDTGVEHGLSDAHRDWFGQSVFSAWSDSYRFSNFSFDPRAGASFTASAVPLPNSAALAVLGLLGLLRSRRAKASATT